MAVLSLMRVTGAVDELGPKMASVQDVGRRVDEKYGGLATIAARTDDGILVVNLWENDEALEAIAEDPKLLEAAQSAGLPQPTVEGFEVLHYTIRPEAVTR
jgi:hypothetical protein